MRAQSGNATSRRRSWRLSAMLLIFGAGGLAPAISEAAEFVDDFRGVMANMPDGTRKLYPDQSKWAFTLAAGVKWPGSFGDGTNWLQANGECQVYLSPFIDKGAGAIPVAQRYDPFSIARDGLHVRAAALTDKQMQLYHLQPSQRFGSGILVSRFKFHYGHVEIVAKLPSSRGSWPAFWLLPADGAWPPEIDIMEGMDWGPHTSQVHSGMIAPDSKQTFADWFKLATDPSQAMHTYSFDWTQSTLTTYFDGVKLWSHEAPQSFNKPMYLLINFAVGGKWVYDELGVRPKGSGSSDRLTKGSDEIVSSYPSDLVVRAVKVETQDITDHW